MEPWLLEEQRQRVAARRARLVCACCGEPVATERYLQLDPMGVPGVACERCVEAYMHHCSLFDREVWQ